MGNTYPNHKGNYYYRNHTLYHIGTLDPLGLGLGLPTPRTVPYLVSITLGFLASAKAYDAVESELADLIWSLCRCEFRV